MRGKSRVAAISNPTQETNTVGDGVGQGATWRGQTTPKMGDKKSFRED